MRLGEFKIDSEHILCTDRYLAANPAAYYKTDVFYHGPVQWRGRRIEPPPFSSDLIVSGHSDYGVGDDLFQKYAPKRWCSVNSHSEHVEGLPLGITNYTAESHLHPIYGNLDIMEMAMRHPARKTELVYMNFNVATYPAERAKVWDMFKDANFVTKGYHDPTMSGRAGFLQAMRVHKFVLCPRGNGVDTHRMWEALYMGAIPIVIDHVAHRGWRDLPILFVDSWEKVKPEFLEAVWEDYSARDWNYEKLDARYWIASLQKGSST